RTSRRMSTWPCTLMSASRPGMVILSVLRSAAQCVPSGLQSGSCLLQTRLDFRRVAPCVAGTNGLVVAQYLFPVLVDVVQRHLDLGEVQLIPAGQFFGRGACLRFGEDVVDCDARAGDLRAATPID